MNWTPTLLWMILLRVLYHSWIQRLEVVFWVQTADRTEAGELYLMTNTVYHYPSTICGYNSHNTRSYAHTAAAYSADDHCCVAPPKIKAPKITASQQRSPLVLLVFFSFFFWNPLSFSRAFRCSKAVLDIFKFSRLWWACPRWLLLLLSPAAVMITTIYRLEYREHLSLLPLKLYPHLGRRAIVWNKSIK